MTISLPALVMIGFGLFWLGGAVALWVFAFCTRGGKALSCINCERDAQFCRGCCDAIGPTPSARVVDELQQLAMQVDAAASSHDERHMAITLGAISERLLARAALSGNPPALSPATTPTASEDGLQTIIADIRHSSKVDDYEPQQLAFLESIASRLAASGLDYGLLQLANEQLRDRLRNCEAALEERDAQVLAAYGQGAEWQASDAEIAAWLERHDLERAIRGTDARCAFEDARSAHMLAAAPTQEKA